MGLKKTESGKFIKEVTVTRSCGHEEECTLTAYNRYEFAAYEKMATNRRCEACMLAARKARIENDKAAALALPPVDDTVELFQTCDTDGNPCYISLPDIIAREYFEVSDVYDEDAPRTHRIIVDTRYTPLPFAKMSIEQQNLAGIYIDDGMAEGWVNLQYFGDVLYATCDYAGIHARERAYLSPEDYPARRGQTVEVANGEKLIGKWKDGVKIA